MTWEETILKIREMPEFADLVKYAFYDKNLKLNVERFRGYEEYSETKKILREYCNKTDAKILDIGAGNGIASVSFALDGYDVIALEPDQSETVDRKSVV